MRSILDFRKMKAEGRKISIITCYDYTSARIAAASGVDCLLVGDSSAMTMHGYADTLAATPTLMAMHTRAVRAGAPAKFIVADMPFLAHRGSLDRTLDAVAEIMRAGADAVKIEGVDGSEDTIRRIVESGVPVMGHLGLRPQSVHQLGGYKTQATAPDAAARLVDQARTLEDCGAFALVLECIPPDLAAKVTGLLTIPTIGIGAGRDCSGQVLVMQDLLGLNTEFRPKFVRRYLDGSELLRTAFDRFDEDVKCGRFPVPPEKMMKWDDLSRWIAVRRDLRRAGFSIGFVPTMGALHAGHVSLLEKARAENDITVLSIYVNPTQFDSRDDLERYPASLDRDLDIAARAGVDHVLLPTDSQMYPDGFRYRIEETELSSRLCGAHRPGHFEGVLTVVLKLLQIAGCDRAYFGEKDYQQLELVRGMTEAFFIDAEIVACPTVREADGLAMSSRNLNLSPEARKTAPLLSRALRESGTAEEAAARLRAAGFEIDYVEDVGNRRFAAASLGDVRLIDNVER